jgi:hypothetical protein
MTPGVSFGLGCRQCEKGANLKIEVCPCRGCFSKTPLFVRVRIVAFTVLIDSLQPIAIFGIASKQSPRLATRQTMRNCADVKPKSSSVLGIKGLF